MQRYCHRCGAEVEHLERVGRRDGCRRCGSDLRCCLNCRFHDPGLHNQCGETQAELQADKERGNFCEFFEMRAQARGAAGEKAATARAGLDALFAKKARG